MKLEEALGVLGLSGSESPEDIKLRFRELAVQWHPDRNPDNPQSEVKTRELLEAYETLRRTPVDQGRVSFSYQFDEAGFFWVPHIFGEEYKVGHGMLGNPLFDLQCGGSVILSSRGKIANPTHRKFKGDIFQEVWEQKGPVKTVNTWYKDNWGAIQTEITLLELDEPSWHTDRHWPGEDSVPHDVDPEIWCDEIDYMLHGKDDYGNLHLHFDAELLIMHSMVSVGQKIGMPLFSRWATRFQEPGRQNRFNQEGIETCYGDITDFLVQNFLVQSGFLDSPTTHDRFSQSFGDTIYPTTLNTFSKLEWLRYDKIPNLSAGELFASNKMGTLRSDLAALCGIRNIGVMRNLEGNSHFSNIYAVPTGDGGLNVHFDSDCEIQLDERHPTLRDGYSHKDKEIADRLVGLVERSKDAIVETTQLSWVDIKDQFARSLQRRNSEYVYEIPKEDLAFLMTLLTEPHITYLEKGATRALPYRTS